MIWHEVHEHQPPNHHTYVRHTYHTSVAAEAIAAKYYDDDNSCIRTWLNMRMGRFLEKGDAFVMH